VGAGVSQGFVVDGSLSRSAVADSVGVKSQLSGILGAALILATLFVLAPLFKNLPNAVLAAIVIVAVAGLVNIKELKRLYRLDLRDFGLALLCLVGVLLLGILPGLLTAIVASLLALVFRAYRPSSAVLGRVPGDVESDDAHLFRNVEGHPEYETYPGLVIFRFDNELFFANAHGFRQHIRELVRDASPPVKEVIVDTSAMSYADTTATDMLNELVAELREHGVALTFARVKRPLQDILERSGIVDAVGADHIHVSLRSAVSDYLRGNPGAGPAAPG
jgi:MFS superfamily sulfate permease-like transporter